jgi:hypothetical protein
MTVSGNVTSDSLEADAGSFTTVTSTTLNGTTGTFTTLNASTVNGTNADFSKVIADSFMGGAFTGTNFTTSSSSVNENYTLAKDIQSDWNSCVAAGGCQ